MKVKYFQNTDTLYIEFRVDRIAETRDLDETPCWNWMTKVASAR